MSSHYTENINGWIILDKPQGVSSNQILRKIQYELHAKKAGHIGTLDPFATGVLPLAFGEATKLIPFLEEGNKTYEFTLKLGQSTSTDDTEGEIIQTSDYIPSQEEIKKIYAMRWGIETSFRELKYAIGLSSFHSKKVEYIMQEIYARLVLYNYCEIITMNVVIHQKDTKHVYQMNYTIAIHICRYFLRNNISPLDVEKLIQKNLLPVRPGRSDPRKVRPKSAVSFLYRVA